jgi:hypothetical protein
MEVLAKAFPQDVTYDAPFDTTKFVSESINEVYKTLIEAGLLVLVVILIFLQDWRAMLVPATTVPVTIIGAFAAMAALGFTVNISTLFAIVLAIGIVVDDAIVVVEGRGAQYREGHVGHDAAISAMDALFAPIIGITLVLISVFLPSAFLPGLTGQMYAQFALVIAATALLSAVNAATLKPTQCALWLRRPVPPEQRNFFYRGFNAVYNRLEAWYSRLIGRLVAHSNMSVICALILIRIAGYGLSRVPTGFIPIEDQGYLLVAVQLPDGAALDRTQRVLTRVSENHRQGAGRRSGDHHCRHLRARQFLQPRQCRRGLSDPEGVERARAGRGSALAVRRIERKAVRDRGGADPGGPAAADPGYRQCRRLCDAGPAPRRQFRLQQVAGDHRRDRRQCVDAERAAAGEFAVPLDGAAVRHRGGPDQDPDPACHDRPDLLDAVVLHGFDLRQPVQQVRPHLPGLCAGGRAIPPDAA